MNRSGERQKNEAEKPEELKCTYGLSYVFAEG
jgi:hypothetical protein